MFERYNEVDGEFCALPGDNRWSFRNPLALFYELHKRVQLVEEALLPDPLISPVSSANMAWFPDRWIWRRWQYAFAARLNAALGGEAVAPAVYPNIIPSQPDSANSVEQVALKFDQYRRLDNRGLIHSYCDCYTAVLATVKSWSWRYLPAPKMRLLQSSEASACADHHDKDALWANLFKFCATADLRALHQVFRTIHRLWAPGADFIKYEVNCMAQIREYLSGKTFGLAALFELEFYASYSTLLKRHKLIASGFYGGRWLDVMAVPLGSLRASAQCEGGRLLDELKSIEAGRTAPISVNEYGCVADGNHRLVAAVIWQILHITAKYKWSLDDESFQAAVACCISCNVLKLHHSTISESLFWLGTFLSNSEQTAIIETLRASIEHSSIDELPAVPLLEYCTAAIAGERFGSDAGTSRFNPTAYDQLCADPELMLQPRACLHLTDCISLPWFSITNDAIRPARPALVTNLRQSISVT